MTNSSVRPQKQMTSSEPPIIQPPPLPRPARWPYWVCVPFCALAYTVFCLGFSLDAWGRRGEAKPWWWDVAGVLAFPGLFIPPFIGAPLWGGAMGFGFIRLVFKNARQRGGKKHRAKESD